MDLIEVGFGRADLWGSWSTEQPLADEIEVRAMATRGPGGGGMVLAADVCGMWPSTCLRLRRAVAQDVGLEEARVGIFCVQNHGAPMEGPGVYDLDRWERAFVAAGRMAWRSARPAHMAVVQTVPSPHGVFTRRKPFRDMGCFSFYFGFRDDGTGGRALVPHLLEQAMHGLLTGPEHTVRSPVDASRWPPAPVPLPEVPADAALEEAEDPLLQGLFFRTPEGEPLGSVSRWAAHPVTANLPGAGHSGDYPAYVRRWLSRNFGGGALFLTGPCGNQAPLVEVKSRELAERVGTRVGGQLLEGLGAASWHPVTAARAASLEVTLPVRADYPPTPTAAARELDATRHRFTAQRRSARPDLGRLKRLSEEIERLDYTVSDVHYGWCGLRPEEHRQDGLRHPLFALQVGPAVIAGLPGEPFGRYSRELRRRFPEIPLVVVEEANGYLSYIPAADEYEQGGYGSAAAILDPAAENVLLDRLGDLIRTVKPQ